MRKLPFVLGALVVALAVLVSGCGSVQPTAVTVNGERISQESVDEELRQIRDNEGYRKAINVAVIEGAGRDGTFAADFAAQVVTLRIYYQLVDQELEERGVEITPEDLRKAREEVELQVSQDPQTGAPDPAVGKRIIGAFSKSYQDTLVRRQAQVVKLQTTLGEGDVTEDKLQAHFEENADQFVEVCVRHVLVDTAEEGASVVAELRRPGADFAAIAKARSKDPSAQENGGDLQCASSTSYVDEFAAASRTQPLNEIGEPVQTSFGFHILQVYGRTTKTFDEVRDEIETQLRSQSSNRLDEWLAEALRTAKIKVNARFGRFDRTPAEGELPRVVAPQPRTTTTLGDADAGVGVVPGGGE